MKKNTISKKMRSGFTMVELLFVMAVLAALAAIAIPQLKGGTESATVTSMRSDARNAISTAQAFYATNEVMPDNGTFTDPGGNGFSEKGLDGQAEAVSAYKLPISKGNTIEIVKDSDSCFTLKVSNTNTPKTIDYDSCADGKIKTTTP